MDNTFPLDDPPSLSRRQLLNFLAGATIAATAGSALYPVAQFMVPPHRRRWGWANRQR